MELHRPTPNFAIPGWLVEQIHRLQDDGSNIRNLNLNIRRLTPVMLIQLCQAVETSRRIEVVNMTSALCSLGSSRDLVVLMPLAKAVEAHTSLTTLHLSYNRLQDASVLASSLAMNRSSLVELNLDHNMLGEDTALALAAMLQTNRRLKLLDLNSNSLHDRGGVALARSLRDNTSLRRLGMARTGIGAETAESFLRTLQDNVTLCRLRLEANQPNLPGILERRCLYLVQANRSGRYLLRDGQGKRNNSDDTKGCNTGIWPFVLERLGPDMVFFFLREDPGLVPSNC